MPPTDVSTSSRRRPSVAIAGCCLWRMGKVVAALNDITAYLDEAPEECPDRTPMTEVAGRLRAFLN